MLRHEALGAQCKLHRLGNGRFVFYDEYAGAQSVAVLFVHLILGDYVTACLEEQSWVLVSNS